MLPGQVRLGPGAAGGAAAVGAAGAGAVLSGEQIATAFPLPASGSSHRSMGHTTPYPLEAYFTIFAPPMHCLKPLQSNPQAQTSTPGALNPQQTTPMPIEAVQRGAENWLHRAQKVLH